MSRAAPIRPAAQNFSRLGAIGTLIRRFRHEFPVVMELAVGVPDLLLGLSAPAVALWVRRGATRVRPSCCGI